MSEVKCQCAVAGYCERRKRHIAELHWRKCQAGQVEVLDRLYSGMKSQVLVESAGGETLQVVRRKGIGDYMHDVITENTGKKPCIDCQSDMKRMNLMTSDEVLASAGNLAVRIIERAKQINSPWWNLHDQAIRLTAVYAPGLAEDIIIDWVHEAVRRFESQSV